MARTEINGTEMYNTLTGKHGYLHGVYLTVLDCNNNVDSVYDVSKMPEDFMSLWQTI